MIGVPLLLLAFLPADEPVKPKIPLGEETTYVAGPLDKHGYVDYEAALNERLGKGVTPENNAVVLIWKAIGPRPEGIRSPRAYFTALGIDEPPEQGEYFTDFQPFVMDRFKINGADLDAASEELMVAGARPWTARDHPRVVAWLAANEKPLATIVEATKRPAYFNPHVAPMAGDKRGLLINGHLHSVQKCRGAVAALTARVMLRIGDRKWDDAWNDLLACHRLPRLVTRGGTLIESLLGFAFEQVANARSLVYVERCPLTARQIQDRLAHLRRLPPTAPLADVVNVSERFMMLDAFRSIQVGGPKILRELTDQQLPSVSDPAELRAMESTDWGAALRTANRWYDRTTADMRLGDRTSRDAEVRKILEELNSLREKVARDRGAGIGEDVSNVIISLFMPAVQKIQLAQDRCYQSRNNRDIAFALAAFRADTGRFPAKLDDLAPKYLAAVPDDLFSGKPLIYRPTDAGYLLYSVGPNGTDDGGRSHDDDPPGDDIVVRMPLPELKAKKNDK
jgi:hypothetical protein